MQRSKLHHEHVCHHGRQLMPRVANSVSCPRQPWLTLVSNAVSTTSQCFIMCRDPEEFDDVFHINVAGVFATIQAFYPLLKV